MQDYLITPMYSTQTNPTQGIYEQSTFLGNQQNLFDVFLIFVHFLAIFPSFPNKEKKKNEILPSWAHGPRPRPAQRDT